MKKALNACVVVVLSTLAGGEALAGTAIVDGLGGAIMMNSNPVAPVFSSASPTFSNADLMTLHGALNADGIATEGKVTAMLFDTASNGLAWAVLVDRETGAAAGAATHMLEMSTTGNSTHMQFINDIGGDLLPAIPPSGSFQTVQGFFTWDAVNKGDGFSWSNLQFNDTFSFDFFRNTGQLPSVGGSGLVDPLTFQFASWDSAAGKWVVVDTGSFSANNQFSYSVRVIPLPQAALLGLIGFAGVGSLRRRKLA